jgi:hypothetical protein
MKMKEFGCRRRREQKSRLHFIFRRFGAVRSAGTGNGAFSGLIFFAAGRGKPVPRPAKNETVPSNF